MIRNFRQPVYTWTKNNQGLPSYIIVAQNRLYIQRVSKNDEGYYELEVTDSNGSLKKSVYVSINEQATVAPVPTTRPGISLLTKVPSFIF
jgi:hypothetical protein